MSFDIDPVDKEKRILAYHPNSNCYFVCKSAAEFEYYFYEGDVDDVTGIKHHEKAYIEQEEKKKINS